MGKSAEGRKEQLFKKMTADHSKSQAEIDAKRKWLAPMGDDSSAVKAEGRRYGL
jgi:hypothetical protein